MLWLLACTAPDDDAQLGTPGGEPFYLGINHPWHEYGVDLHGTAWGDYTVSASEDEVRAQLGALADAGARSVRWWMFGDGRGLSFAADGAPEPLDDETLANAELLLRLADETELTVIPVVLDFGWCDAAEDVNGVQLGGHADVFADADKRAALVEGVVGPLAAAFADDATVVAWDLFNEPEWAFDGEMYGMGDHCDPEGVHAYVDEATSAIAEVAPQPTMVGSASYAWMVEHWVDASPPVLQFHDYWEDLGTLDSDLGKPVIVGEFATAGVDMTAMLDTALARGFAGAMPWSGYAEDDASAMNLDEFARWADANAVGGEITVR